MQLSKYIYNINSMQGAFNISHIFPREWGDGGGQTVVVLTKHLIQSLTPFWMGMEFIPLQFGMSRSSLIF